MAATLIKYAGVEIRQEEQVVLSDVNFEIGEGEWVYLLGRVGSGKSSLLKTFYGELPIASGQAQLLEYDLTKLRKRQVPYLRRKIGIVFQDFQLCCLTAPWRRICCLCYVQQAGATRR